MVNNSTKQCKDTLMLMPDLANHVYQQAIKSGIPVKTPYVSVIDYTLPSNQKRLFVYNVKTHQLLLSLRVAQGKNSGLKYATAFSNQPQSKKSSLGVYLTGPTYWGKHGESMRLKGLTPHFNTNAAQRDIVVHSAWYLTNEFVQQHGRAGRSWGCLALSPNKIHQFINQTENGSLIVAYYPDPTLMKSPLFS